MMTFSLQDWNPYSAQPFDSLLTLESAKVTPGVYMMASKRLLNGRNPTAKVFILMQLAALLKYIR
jgi:hypothetical protein